jgi:hypothetical protein
MAVARETSRTTSRSIRFPTGRRSASGRGEDVVASSTRHLDARRNREARSHRMGDTMTYPERLTNG